MKKIVRIGRLKNSETDFSFADEDVSRKQCILTYEDNNWYICDGDGENESSNGTWFYPEKYFTITDGMILKLKMEWWFLFLIIKLFVFVLLIYKNTI